MNKNRLLVPAAYAALAIVATLAIALFVLPAIRKPVIAYYGLPETVLEAITALADDPAFSGKTKFGIVVLDGAKPLAEQIGKKNRVDVVFAYDGAALAAASGTAIVPSEQIRLLMPLAIRATGTRFGTGYAQPILLDHFEVAYDASAFAGKGLGEPKSLDALLAGARETARPGMWPIVCAGGNDRDLLLLVGALVDAKYGPEARAKIVADLREKGSLKQALSNAALRGTLDELIEWRKSGLLHPEWFRMKDADLVAYLEKGYTRVALMPFSTHRAIPLKTISRFASIPFPPSRLNSPRELAAPVVVGMLPAYRRPNAAAAELLYRLAREEGQMVLSAKTGLAPVNSTVPSEDIQAADVRLWVASSSGPVPDPASAAFADPAKVAETARDIRAYVEAEGNGF
jgi:hypothetical protein